MANYVGVDFDQLCLKLEEILKCPECLEYFEAPVMQCLRGHGVCGRCKKSSECRLCKSQILTQKASLLSQLADVIPRVCKYRSAGCPAISLARENHHTFCGFRPIKCMICGTSVSVNFFGTHYETHKRSIETDKMSGFLSDIRLKETTSKFSLLSYCRHLFWKKISVDVEKQIFTITIVCIPTSKPTHNFWVEIIFKKEKWNFSSFSPILFMTDPDLTIQPNIILPLQAVPHFLNNTYEPASCKIIIQEEKDD